jgi:hypothetical protein
MRYHGIAGGLIFRKMHGMSRDRRDKRRKRYPDLHGEITIVGFQDYGHDAAG